MNTTDLKIGGRYNWIGQPERLVYMGIKQYDGDPRTWYNFAKVDKPDTCWCEVLAEDLKGFEKTALPSAPPRKVAVPEPPTNEAMRLGEDFFFSVEQMGRHYLRGYEAGQAPLQQQLTVVTAAWDDAEEEVNCVEAVLDGFAAELPEEPFINGFECAGDYVTAVVEGYKAKLAKLQEAHDAWKRNAELADAANRDLKAKMEAQKDTWLSWEGKRKDLEDRAAASASLAESLSWYRGAFEVLLPLRYHLHQVCESPYRKDYIEAAKTAADPAESYFSGAKFEDGQATKAPAVFAYRRKGLEGFVTCSEEQYNELAQKELFEVAKFVRVD